MGGAGLVSLSSPLPLASRRRAASLIRSRSSPRPAGMRFRSRSPITTQPANMDSWTAATWRADHGMLFEFDRDAPVAFWMKNTYIPLDMIFIAPSGRCDAYRRQRRAFVRARHSFRRTLHRGARIERRDGGFDRAQGGRQGSSSVLQIVICTQARCIRRQHCYTRVDNGRRLPRRREAGWEWFESSFDVESRSWVSRAVFSLRARPARAMAGAGPMRRWIWEPTIAGCWSRGRPPRDSGSSTRSRASFA